MTFPFRLILSAYSLAGLAAVAAFLAGAAGWAALLIFWLGGSALIFLLPAAGYAVAAMRAQRRAASWRAELRSARNETRQEAALAAWEADLAVDQMQTRRAIDLNAWDADSADEAQDGAMSGDATGTDGPDQHDSVRPLRTGSDRRTNNRRQRARRGG